MAIDILRLVDRLEDLIEKGRHIPFSSAVIVSESVFLDIIDQMRISVPEEIKQARRLQQEREKVIAEAQEEAARIIARAREDAARLVSEHELRQQAQEGAQRILAEAERQAKIIHQGADDYAVEALTRLSEELAAVQRTVANGLAMLSQRRRSAQEPGAAVPQPAKAPGQTE